MALTTPDTAATMADVRAAVDELDRRLITMLAERMRWMDAAARIKPERGQVRDDARKQQVIGNVMAHAVREGYDPQLAAALWEEIVEASIAYELDAWDRRRDTAR